MSFRKLTPHQYEEAVRYYREHPGDVMGCARALGIDWRTASKWWKGPQSKGPATLFAVPVQDVLALEKRRAEESRSEREAALRAEVLEQQAKAKAAADEVLRLDEAVLKLARSDVLNALGGLSRLSKGINKLAERVNTALEEGTDAQGKPLVISPEAALRILHRYAVATKGLVEAAHVLLGIDNTKAGLPSTIVGIDVSHVSLEQAIEQHALAADMIEDAKRMGLLPGHVDVGKAARPTYAVPAGTPEAGAVPLPRERH